MSGSLVADYADNCHSAAPFTAALLVMIHTVNFLAATAPICGASVHIGGSGGARVLFYLSHVCPWTCIIGLVTIDDPGALEAIPASSASSPRHQDQYEMADRLSGRS